MPTNINTCGVFSTKEITNYLKVTERIIYRLAEAKQMPAFKIGGNRRFSKADIEAWIRDHNALKKAN